MPNWCQNKLTVQSYDGDAVLSFIQSNALEGRDPDANKLSFSRALPIPPELLDENADRNAVSIWQAKNWGVNWDACDVGQWQHGQAKLGARYATIHFETAWSPPVPWLRRVGELHPMVDLRLEFSESGMGFQGISYVEAGFYNTMEIDYYRNYADEREED
jgi:hypothetical protein